MSNIVTLTIIFTLFLLMSLFWYQIAGICTEEAMASSAITVMAVTFLAGLAGNAAYIYPVAMFLAVAGIFLFLFNKGKGKSEEKFWKRMISFLSPSLVVIALIFIYCVVCFRRALFTYPDEIHQWGSAVKYMVETCLLPYGDKFTGDDVTFSICTIFQYFFSGLGNFIERNAFVGNFMLTFIPIMLPCRKVGWKKWKSVFAYAAIMFLALNLISYVKYYTLLQDYALPMWTGGILAWVLWRREEKINWVLLFCSLTMIGAMKSLVGPLCVCMIILATFLSVYYRDCDDCIAGIAKLSRILQKKYLCFLPLVITPVLFNMIWSSMISVNVLSRGIGSTSKDAGQILDSIIDRSFMVLESATNSFPYMSYIIFFGLYAAGVYMLASALKKHRNEFRAILLLYLSGAFLYLGVMYYAYLNVFGVSDSEVVAGLDRYLAYFMLTGVSTLVFPLYYKIEEVVRTSSIRATACVLAIACLYGTGGSSDFVTKVSTVRREQEGTWNKRMEIQQQVKELKDLLEDDGHIFVVGKADTNNLRILTYELGSQYNWENDSYAVDVRAGKKKILVNVAKYPEILTETGYQYVWFIDPKEKDHEYDYLRHYFKFESTEDGDIYEIRKVDDKYRFIYLGNIPTEDD